MLDLTKEEKLVVIFFVICFLAGAGVNYFKKELKQAGIIPPQTPAEAIPAPAEKININKATFTELISIRGIGPKTATSIMEYRFENGTFFSLEEIMNVKGIGEAKFKSIKDYITL